MPQDVKPPYRLRMQGGQKTVIDEADQPIDDARVKRIRFKTRRQHHDGGTTHDVAGAEADIQIGRRRIYGVPVVS